MAIPGLMELAERDLSITLEGAWSLPVIITRKSDDHTQTVQGQVLKDSVKVNEDGIPEIDLNPVVSLRVSSLTEVPEDGENWYFDIPVSPVQGAEIKRFMFGGDDARRGFLSIGLLTYPLKTYTDERT
jgi:hypothetical protein